MRRLPPLAALRAFEAAARHLSFKAAADELGLTTTAISHQIRLLEEYCGHTMFRRRPRPLALTGAGERVFPVLRDGLDKFAAAFAELRPATGCQLPLRITTTNAFAHRWLVPHLSQWQQHRPDIALEIVGTDEVIDLHSGGADIAIRYQRAPPAALRGHQLLRDTFWPVGRADLLARVPVHEPADFRRHTLIHMHWQASEPSPPTWKNWFHAARAQGSGSTMPTGERDLSFREELHAIEAVIEGQGIAILSDVLVARELASGLLVRALDVPLPGFGFYLAYLPNHTRQPTIDALCAWIRSVGLSCGRT